MTMLKMCSLCVSSTVLRNIYQHVWNVIQTVMATRVTEITMLGSYNQ